MENAKTANVYRRLTDTPELLVTRWSRPEENIESGIYGDVTYREWCKREVSRMCGAGRSVAIIDSECGMIAIEMTEAVVAK